MASWAGCFPYIGINGWSVVCICAPVLPSPIHNGFVSVLFVLPVVTLRLQPSIILAFAFGLGLLLLLLLLLSSFLLWREHFNLLPSSPRPFCAVPFFGACIGTLSLPKVGVLPFDVTVCVSSTSSAGVNTPPSAFQASHFPCWLQMPLLAWNCNVGFNTTVCKTIEEAQSKVGGWAMTKRTDGQ